ncbi:MAG: HEAT repeat domain-containing protein [Anaerolineae bacterium]|jgi:HEAT repeat protein|nr:HEAT repeat domain-containing protein [Anaerolineae bacterium]MBT4459636.1 HEAT repeat domain-containing protein [Anaerolineae bacterium]MBT4841607.1 HEAT repeat domain-containing protein [Anaerolineae bacterium]MBT6059669.1 HEAT repeat domain-containing protein [Anaerolineae bacterium]MBT6323737.1 HEAT repeat domain-containing protein [Anaerolineae bacterium]
MAWLSDRKEEFNIKRLLGMLGSSDLKKRNRAAREFLKLGMEGAEGLVSTLGSQEVELREITTQILIRLGTQAVPALNNAIQNAPTSIQEEIISILGKMKNQAALEKLFEFLKGENFKLQIFAAKALAETGDPQAVSYLLVALSDSDPDVRVASAIALGKFRDPETYVNIADLLDDVEINVRVAAAKTLGEIKDPNTIPYLIEALHDSFWWYGREEAIQTLLDSIASFGKAAFDELKEAVNAKEPTVRRYAIALLRPLQDPRIMDALEMAFYDTNYDVAESALIALIEFGEGAMPIMTEALVSPNDWIREKAAWGLGEIGGEEATIYLLEMLKDEANSVHKETIAALSKLKDPRALPTLHAISLKRENREIAKLARQAIAAIEAS